jgi:hypothetical protein
VNNVKYFLNQDFDKIKKIVVAGVACPLKWNSKTKGVINHAPTNKTVIHRAGASPAPTEIIVQ